MERRRSDCLFPARVGILKHPSSKRKTDFACSYLQVLFPFLGAGVSLAHLGAQTIVRQARPSIHSRSGNSSPLSRSTEYVSGGTTAVGSIEQSEDEQGDISDELAPPKRAVKDSGRGVEVLDRPRGQKTILAIEILALLAEVAIHTHALAAGPHGYHAHIAAIAGIAVWTYITILAFLRLALIHTRKITVPHLWDHTAALYILMWFTVVLTFRSAVIHPSSSLTAKTRYADFALASLLMLIAVSTRRGNKAVLRNYENDLKPSNEPLASLISLCTFAWADAIVWQGYKKQYELKDVWNLLPRDRCVNILEEYRQLKKTTILAWHFVRFFKQSLLVQVAWTVLSAFLTFVPTLLLKAILEYVENPEEISVNAAWLYVILLALSGCITAVADGQGLWIGRKICINLRAIIIGEVYAKTLRRRAAASSDTVLGIKAKQASDKAAKSGMLARIRSLFATQTTQNEEPPKEDSKKEDKDSQVNTGTIINLMAVDASKASEVSAYLHFLFPATPIQIVIAIYLLWRILGYSALASLIIMLGLLPVQMWIASRFSKAQKRIMAATDGRIHVMNEVLQNIRIIKYFAWEDRFGFKVNEKRAIEIRAIRSRFMLWTFASVIWNGVPLFITAVSFIIYTAIEKKPLIPSIAFTALSLFSLLRYPLDRIADMLAHIQEAKVSIDRVDEFLNEDETEKFEQLTPEPEYENGEIRMGFSNATLSWGGRHEDATANSQAFRLISLDVRFRPGCLNIVAGATGSGKSSLLMGLLGEMTLRQGKVHFPGGYIRQELRPDPETGLTESVAYCAQQAWLVNDTIKQNIVFASTWDEKRYETVIAACALGRDLQVLSEGDSTLVGEKGIVVSGGQKQRISLARALYSNARHVLLDDCLSAVDSHTAQHIFEECIMGPLMLNRTCILVTHNIALCVPRSSFVVVLSNGKVVGQGKPREVMASGVLGDEASKSRPTSKDGTRAPSPTQLENKLKDTNGSDSTLQETKANGHTEASSNHDTGKKLTEDKDKDPNVSANARTEQIAQGGAKWAVVKTYLESMGPWYYWFFVLVGFTLESITFVTKDLWIRQWANSYAIDSIDTIGVGSASGYRALYISDTTGTIFSGNAIAMGFPMSPANTTSEEALQASAVEASNPFYYLGIYIALGLVYISTFVFKLGVMFKGSLNASRKIHSRLLQNVMRATFGFFDKTPIGQITNRFSKDLDTIDNDILLVASGVLQSLFGLVMIIVLISSITPGFFLPAAVLTLVYFGIGFIYIRSSRDLKRLESAQRSPIYQQFGETLSGVTTIRAYGDETRFAQENATRVNNYNRPFIYLWATNRWLALRVDLAGAFVSFFASVFVILNVGKIDAGAAGLSLTYAVMFNEQILWLVRLWATTEQNAAVVERVKEYLDVDQEAPASVPENKPPGNWPTSGAIDFVDYSTRYRKDLDPVLNNLNFSIQGEEKVGIVGRTGAGKSSLAMALFRGLEATSGKILIDDVDIGIIGLQDLREAITIVPQDPTLFMGTIRSNLDPFGLFTDEEILTSLRQVHLIGEGATNTATEPQKAAEPAASLTPPRSPELLAVPSVEDLGNGAPDAENELTKVLTNSRENSNIFINLSSTIAESGSNLSQGQRQLLCLARALLKAPRVLVMDEATASIDYATDTKIQETLRTVKGSTIITIAHRLQTIIDYDKVLVLDKGSVIECAAPWELIETEGGIFRGMCEMSGDFEGLREGARKAGQKQKLVDI